ncbi:membrane-bound lytic murein transglycosylase B [Methylohalomonas lacus]|uniref:Membrane-bound lytic murein transglycosylase B n=1 Tax=Methylohalomonas lacus TaxID=398773 RepID=A0AAE3HMF6_9GAMM|nr:lytic murein transglycosylase B [Methylohalomonas lacus]MCS3903163.1 membrane-bound lytic murein transglycosylase B [Methylohalomonas lacus]
MKNIIANLLTLAMAAMLCTSCVHAANEAEQNDLDSSAVSSFIADMVRDHGFEEIRLQSIFDSAEYKQSIIDAITRPAEKMPWYRYKKIFVTDDRARAGVDYWHKHADTLADAEREFGVPTEIIVAIIGVETRYGAYTGKYRVVDALATLAFHYPKRADFFRSELKEFLILARQQDVDPLSIKGSYAGAMGIPQFIASSYRNYAIDFDDDNRVDLWANDIDAIGSVANYFRRHGWQPGEPVIFAVTDMPSNYTELERSELKPNIDYAQLQQSGVEIDGTLDPDTRVALLEFEGENGPIFRLGLDNFYVITRYNHSRLYALAVYLLAQEIRERYENLM